VAHSRNPACSSIYDIQGLGILVKSIKPFDQWLWADSFGETVKLNCEILDGICPDICRGLNNGTIGDNPTQTS
jgi:hypothetical protein